jgi:hypothetical protein
VALFGALALAIFARFFLFGETLLETEGLRRQLGLPVPPRRAFLFGSGEPPGRHNDQTLVLLPSLRIYNEGLHRGELRLWNPTLLCGVPLSADPMLHPFYPPRLLLHAALPVEIAYEVEMLLHLFFAGAAMTWALRVMGRGRFAATIGGVIWMLWGYSAVWFATGVLMGVSVFGPLAHGCIVRGLERGSLRWAGGAALAMGAAILGSHPQYALLVFLFLSIVLLAAFVRGGGRRRFVAVFGSLFALLAVGVGSVELLARLDMLATGYRDPAANFALFYRDAGEALRQALTIPLGKIVTPQGGIIGYELYGYTGLTVLALAGVGVWGGWREPGVRLAALLGAAALLAAYVRPCARIAGAIPVLSIGSPTRWILLFGYCAAVLAARGVEVWPLLTRNARRVAGGVVALLAASLGVALWSRAVPGYLESAVGFVLAAAALLVPVGRARLRGAGVAAGVLFELLPVFVTFNPHEDAAVLREAPAPVAMVRMNEREPWRAVGTMGTILHYPDPEFELTYGSNYLAGFLVESPAGFQSIVPASYARFAVAAGAHVGAAGRLITFFRLDSPLLDLAGVKYLWVPSEAPPPPHFRPWSRWRHVRIYENTRALPRAFVVAGVREAASLDEAAELLRRIDPAATAVVETGRSGTLSEPGRVAARIEWTERTPDRSSLKVTTDRPGLLVIVETHDPGWEAAVDGKPVGILRTDAAFRGIPLEAGAHEVTMRFRPAWLGRGLVGSIGFVVGLIAWLLVPSKLLSFSRDQSRVDLKP